MDVGSWTHPGNRYGELNQDYAVIKNVADAGGQSSCYTAAVLDGHGLLGEQAAQLAGDVIAETLSNGVARLPLSRLSEAEQTKLMQEAFLQAHKAALTLYERPPESYSYCGTAGEVSTYRLTTSAGIHVYQPHDQNKMGRPLECGATCTALLVEASHFCIANVGDSTAVLGRDVGDQYQAEKLTETHYGLNDSEAERLRILDNPGSMLLPGDGYLAITSGAWAGYELSVTRALGHKHLEPFGVTWQPHVMCRAVQPQDCCLVLASDGVWEELGEEEVVKRVMDAASQGLSAEEAAKQLVEEAVYLAKNGPEQEADNTTAVVLLFS